MSPTVAIVGGGVAGLGAALHLRDEAPDVRVVLLEASGILGGKLATMDLDGVQLETGADSFITTNPVMERLCARLGVAEEMIEPAIFGGLLWDGGKAQPLPTGTVLGIPASSGVALSAGVLSPAERLRALGDLLRSGPLKGPDVSVGEFVTRRFGTGVLNKMVDPILSGTRAGDPYRMSLAAALPQVDAVARSHRSVMRGLTRPGGRPRFLTHPKGMSTLVEAWVKALEGADIRTGSPVETIAPTTDGLEVHLSGGETIRADAVVVATPAHHAAGILAGAAPQATEGLERIRHASVAAIGLIFDRGAVQVPEGSSGMLVPSSHARSLSAATWWSAKWPHSTPGDRFVIRCFVGRADRHPLLDGSDEELAAAALEEVSKVATITAAPLTHHVTRWDNGLPQYEVGHLELLDEIDAHLPPGIALAGADYRGTGIPDCLLQGRAAATRLLEGVRGTRR